MGVLLEKMNVALATTSVFADEYRRRARLKPAILEVLPVVLVLGVLVCRALGGLDAATKFGGGIATLVSALGLTALLEQLGRDRGKKKEPSLWARWGGAPTTQLLRHGSTSLCDPLTRRRYHQKLTKLLPEVRLPSAEEESADPTAADRIYEACIRFLISRTRDRRNFPLVFEENVNYGFRRNLWGMRAAGLTVSLAGTFAAAVELMVTVGTAMSAAWLSVLLVNAAFVAWWVFRINPDWVLIAGRAYADRLTEAIDSL